MPAIGRYGGQNAGCAGGGAARQCMCGVVACSVAETWVAASSMLIGMMDVYFSRLARSRMPPPGKTCTPRAGPMGPGTNGRGALDLSHQAHVLEDPAPLCSGSLVGRRSRTQDARYHTKLRRTTNSHESVATQAKHTQQNTDARTAQQLNSYICNQLNHKQSVYWHVSEHLCMHNHLKTKHVVSGNNKVSCRQIRIYALAITRARVAHTTDRPCTTKLKLAQMSNP